MSILDAIVLFVYMSFIFIRMAIFLHLLLLFVCAIAAVVFGAQRSHLFDSREKKHHFFLPPNVFFIFGILFSFHAPPIYTPNITYFFFLSLLLLSPFRFQLYTGKCTSRFCIIPISPSTRHHHQHHHYHRSRSQLIDEE